MYAVMPVNEIIALLTLGGRILFVTLPQEFDTLEQVQLSVGSLG